MGSGSRPITLEIDIEEDPVARVLPDGAGAHSFTGRLGLLAALDDAWRHAASTEVRVPDAGTDPAVLGGHG
jgi:hypothetical protein